MAYSCELAPGSTLYLDNPAGETVVTLAIAQPGQQQQSSSRLQTGRWTAPPEISRDDVGGTRVKILAERGEFVLSVRGSSISLAPERAAGDRGQAIPLQSVADVPEPPPMQPMAPMQPMHPMQPMAPMQPMQMDAGGMQMRMGNMEMRMGSNAPVEGPAIARTETKKRFCSQCGAAVQPSDRFCSSCGHPLNP